MESEQKRHIDCLELDCANRSLEVEDVSLTQENEGNALPRRTAGGMLGDYAHRLGWLNVQLRPVPQE